MLFTRGPRGIIMMQIQWLLFPVSAQPVSVILCTPAPCYLASSVSCPPHSSILVEPLPAPVPPNSLCNLSIFLHWILVTAPVQITQFLFPPLPVSDSLVQRLILLLSNQTASSATVPNHQQGESESTGLTSSLLSSRTQPREAWSRAKMFIGEAEVSVNLALIESFPFIWLRYKRR